LVSRSPKDSDELFFWHMTGKNSIYQNSPCPEAFKTDDLSNVVVNLEQLDAMFYVLVTGNCPNVYPFFFW
jgi:hypothetical protein